MVTITIVCITILLTYAEVAAIVTLVPFVVLLNHAKYWLFFIQTFQTTQTIIEFRGSGIEAAIIIVFVAC